MEGKKSRIDSTTTEDMVMVMVIDRISHLPDFILGHILSFLPTQNAVATSVLSKRWKFTWFSVHNLDFTFVVPYDERRQCKDKNMKFAQFVDRVLLLHDGGSINKFSLYWQGYNISSYQSHVISWINFAITRNVQSLYLSVDDSLMFDIPISSFSCDTLRSLELRGISLVCDATASVCLPRLESLKFDFYCGSTEACEKLIRGCPVLQDLYLDIAYFSQVEGWCMSSNVFSCDSLQSFKLNGEISVPATVVVCCTRLKILELGCVSFESKEACEKLISGCPKLQYLDLTISSTSNGDDDDDIFTCIISSASLRYLEIDFRKKSKLVLKASSLLSFKVIGNMYEISVEKSLRSLVSADFLITLVEHEYVNNSIVEAVSAFDRAIVLTLSSSVMWALSRATVSISTEFKRLRKLCVDTFCSSIQDVLQNSNNLQDLIIYQQFVDRHDHPRWTTPVEVPRCLSNSLKSVRFCGYNDSEGEREMIRYILEHGSALKAMNISEAFMRDAEKFKLRGEISMFPRKSTDCVLNFSL